MYTNMPFLVAGKFGAGELIVILLIVLVLFGPKQLPKLSKMFGKSIKNFKDGMQEGCEDEKTEGPAPSQEEAKKAEASSDKVD